MEDYTLYKTTIKPLSSFSTSLKGDTLFGQICWAIIYKYGEKRLEELLSSYDKEPFLIVSDGFAKGYLPKPKLPSFLLGEDPKDKKENRKKIWLSLSKLQDGDFLNAKTDKEVGEDSYINIVRNSINYKEFKTDGDSFSPYSEDETILKEKDIYFLLSKKFSKDELTDSLSLLSDIGYGKDTTIGKGRFEFDDLEEIDINFRGKYFLTLSPSDFSGVNGYYETFVRFGKLGGNRANTNPFKKPLILADSGAVVEFKEIKECRYIGQAIKNISTYDDVVHQGYAITIPIGVKNEKI